MLQKFEVTGLHFDIDKALRNYIAKKLGSLDRYVPKATRSSAHLEVRVKETKQDGKVRSVCEATLHLPHETINLTESALNMHAAIDIVQDKLRQQIKKYKDESMNGKQRRHIFGRLRRSLSARLRSA